MLLPPSGRGRHPSFIFASPLRAKYEPFFTESDLLTIQQDLDPEFVSILKSSTALLQDLGSTLDRVTVAIESLEDLRDAPVTALGSSTLVSVGEDGGEGEEEEGLFGDIPSTGALQSKFSPAQERRLLR